MKNEQKKLLEPAGLKKCAGSNSLYSIVCALCKHWIQYRCLNLHHVHHHIHVLLSTFTNLNLFVGALYSTRYMHVSKEHVAPWQIKVQSCSYMTSQRTRPSSSTDHHLLVTSRTSRTCSPSCLEVTDWKICFKSQCEDKERHWLFDQPHELWCGHEDNALLPSVKRFVSRTSQIY